MHSGFETLTNSSRARNIHCDALTATTTVSHPSRKECAFRRSWKMEDENESKFQTF